MGPIHLSALELWHVLAALAVGRVVLSLLPPGEPGGHGPRELPATLATSAFLGGAVVLAVAAVPVVGGALLVGGVLVLAVVRVATLPGAMAPRRPVAAAHAGLAVTVFRLAFVGYAAFALVRWHVPVLFRLGALVLVGHALARVGCRAWVRWGLLALGAVLALGRRLEDVFEAGFDGDLVWQFTAWLDGDPGWVFGAAGAFVALWARLADRRALAVAALLVLVLVTRPGTVALAAGGAVALFFGSPAVSRPRAARALVLAALVLAGWLVPLVAARWPALGSLVHLRPEPLPLLREAVATPLRGVVTALFLVSAAGALLPGRRELRAVVGAILVAAATWTACPDPLGAAWFLDALVPAIVLAAGLLSAPASRPSSAASTAR